MDRRGRLEGCGKRGGKGCGKRGGEGVWEEGGGDIFIFSVSSSLYNAWETSPFDTLLWTLPSCNMTPPSCNIV